MRKCRTIIRNRDSICKNCKSAVLLHEIAHFCKDRGSKFANECFSYACQGRFYGRCEPIDFDPPEAEECWHRKKCLEKCK